MIEGKTIGPWRKYRTALIAPVAIASAGGLIGLANDNSYHDSVRSVYRDAYPGNDGSDGFLEDRKETIDGWPDAVNGKESYEKYLFDTYGEDCIDALVELELDGVGVSNEKFSDSNLRQPLMPCETNDDLVIDIDSLVSDFKLYWPQAMHMAQVDIDKERELYQQAQIAIDKDQAHSGWAKGWQAGLLVGLVASGILVRKAIKRQ